MYVDVIYDKYIVDYGPMRMLRRNWARFLVCTNAIPLLLSAVQNKQ